MRMRIGRRWSIVDGAMAMVDGTTPSTIAIAPSTIAIAPSTIAIAPSTIDHRHRTIDHRHRTIDLRQTTMALTAFRNSVYILKAHCVIHVLRYPDLSHRNTKRTRFIMRLNCMFLNTKW